MDSVKPDPVKSPERGKSRFWTSLGQFWFGSLAGHTREERLANLRTKVAILFVAAVLIAFIAIWRATSGSAAFASIWAMAFMVCGIVLGFLFGIPKTTPLTTEPPRDNEDSDPQPDKTAKGSPTPYRQNTSLEEISDWLTKIIVGIGLVEFKALTEAFRTASETLAVGLSKIDESYTAIPLAQALIVFFTAAGFLGGYLLTRLYLAGLFRLADVDLGDEETRRRISQMSASIAGMKSTLDAVAANSTQSPNPTVAQRQPPP